MQSLPQALAPFARYRQFLCYVLYPSARPGKMDKIPVSPHSGAIVDAHDPQHWTTAEHACSVATLWGPSFGVAFVFTAQDPFFFVDIDDCFDATARWSPLAQQIAGMFPGAAMEISQSGKGLHIFGTGRAPTHGKKNAALKMEFYTELRFVALTGTQALGDASVDCTAALHRLVAEYFPATATAGGDFSLSDAPVDAWRGPVDDEELLRRAMMSKSAASAFGRGASFADLWHADADALSRAYPDPGRGYDASQADAALVSHLAFWTGRHGERIDRLMRRSALAREKWQREDYLPRTISEILARPGDVLIDKAPEPVAIPLAAPESPRQTEVEGQTFMSPAQQKDLFAGCVYVQDLHKVLVPGGSLLNAERFRAVFGGYAFSMDARNERVTRNAWEAFTESQCLRPPRADSICFRPTEAPALISHDSGKSRVNTWWPADVQRAKGDPSPFLEHLAKVLPDGRDRAIMLAYMSACVQHKGVKFQWAPVLQGAEGNGKTVFSACLSEALGQHYVHWPHAYDLVSQFNAWVANKLLIAVEELYSQEHSAEIVERLKTLIAGGPGVQIQAKGVDQYSTSIVANFILTTNYKNAVRKTADNARRLALFYTAQQTKQDIIRDGMGGDYFPRLYRWLKKEGGYAIVSEMLYTHSIPSELDPAGALHRAPDTSSTVAALLESRGGVEQQIAELIAQDTPGFMGGWVSSVMLDRVITDTLKMGSRLSHSKRREMLAGMGYVLHPGLSDGRVNNPVLPDGRKPQLFILENHPSRYISGAAEIARAYTAAQTPSRVG
jgi:hypothetical protein